MSGIWGNVSRSLYDAVDNRLLVLREGELLARCDSEIERAFLATFLLLSRLGDIRLRHEFEEKESSGFVLVPQVRIGDYRVDFVLGVPGRPLSRCIVIECDGHDFHEKTKEQASRDKSRDRFLNTKVAKVIRFTGSEIFRDPSSCCAEALSILNALRSAS